MSGPDRDRLYERNDELLRPLIDAPDEPARELAIEALIRDAVKPVIASIIKRFRRTEPNLHIEDQEEISSLVVLRFIRKLRATAAYEEHAIQGIENYVTRLTYNALYDFRRAHYPERHRLKRNLRYILTRSPELALWESIDDTVAGLAGWEGRPPRAPHAFTRASATAAMFDREQPVQALRTILERLGHPVAFETLVDLAADLWNVRDVVLADDDFPPDERPDQLSSMARREYLETLWAEIRELPMNQRVALLLNLRDSGGSNALALFLLLNVADVAEIARLVGFTEDELTRWWEQLPLEDRAIADRLRLTRQQIINLRKAARTRLTRRMSKWK